MWLNFHPLEVVSRWRDPQLQVSENSRIHIFSATPQGLGDGGGGGAELPRWDMQGSPGHLKVKVRTWFGNNLVGGEEPD